MRELVGVTVAILVLTSALLGVFALSGVGAAAGNQPAENASQDGEAWTLEDLPAPGMQIEGRDPSTRYLGTKGSVYAAYEETNFIKELSKIDEPEWAVDKVVTPGEVVDTQELTLHVARMKNAEPETVHVHVVQAEKKRVDVGEGNQTRMETQIVNATHRVHEMELSGGGDKLTVPLPHTDDEKTTWVWIEEYDDARWVFQHDPVATTNATPFDANWASFLPWFATRFLLVVGIGAPMAVGAAIRTLDKTGNGPGKGMGYWVIVPGFLTYMAGYFALGKMAEFVVTIPWALGLLLVAIVYIAVLEYADPTKRLLIEQITTTSSTNALGEKVKEIKGEQGALFNAVKRDEDSYYLVKQGNLKSWLVVAFTDAEWPVLDVEDLKSWTSYQQGSSDGDDVADIKLYSDEDQDQVIDVTWPTISFGPSNLKVRRDQLPDPDDPSHVETPETIFGDWDREKVSSAFMAWAIGTLIASAVVGFGTKAAALGLLPVMRVTARVTSGASSFAPAPEHGNRAKATRVAETHEMNVARTFEEATEQVGEDERNLAQMAVSLAETRTREDRKTLRRLLGLEDDQDQDQDERDADAGAGKPSVPVTDGGGDGS